LTPFNTLILAGFVLLCPVFQHITLAKESVNIISALTSAEVYWQHGQRIIITWPTCMICFLSAPSGARLGYE
jgi:hypothetical protein